MDESQDTPQPPQAWWYRPQTLLMVLLITVASLCAVIAVQGAKASELKTALDKVNSDLSIADARIEDLKTQLIGTDNALNACNAARQNDANDIDRLKTEVQHL